ncbi:6645_t:CDS:2 [Ambispora gerdemannii]|uniref:non-reducing end alpha-L-arabinofuranosidase n=1 Tax=Ambispora gerdemannii TaxID=144530 RepID=A0A9N9EKP9_9GLOM|nr:6645_t:CDS:2 [Ambispora gerdemannii]
MESTATKIKPPEIGAIESSNNVEYYVSHQDFLGLIRQLDQSDPVSNFIFKLVPGLHGSGISFESIDYPDKAGVRFQSVNFPSHFIRHRSNNELWIDLQEDTNRFMNDSTFKYHKFFKL